MAGTSSIYDHFVIWPPSVTLTFNLPEQEQFCQFILKSMYKCRSNGFPCDLDLQMFQFQIFEPKQMFQMKKCAKSFEIHA